MQSKIICKFFTFERSTFTCPGVRFMCPGCDDDVETALIRHIFVPPGHGFVLRGGRYDSQWVRCQPWCGMVEVSVEGE